jgi:hypothetical protein
MMIFTTATFTIEVPQDLYAYIEAGLRIIDAL